MTPSPHLWSLFLLGGLLRHLQSSLPRGLAVTFVAVAMMISSLVFLRPPNLFIHAWAMQKTTRAAEDAGIFGCVSVRLSALISAWVTFSHHRPPCHRHPRRLPLPIHRPKLPLRC